MRVIIIFLLCTLGFSSRSQTCDTGRLDPRVEMNLRQIGDLTPVLNTTSLEQAKQDKFDNPELYPLNDVTIVKITPDSIPVYVFNATHDNNIPVILYFHPGGFVTPFLPFMKYDCWKMSKDLQAIVFAVDYRIAPAHKFPAAVMDAYRAFEWLLVHGNVYGGNINNLVIAGASAGANLAAVVSHKARDKGLASTIKLQVLNCPSVDNIYHHSQYASYERYAVGYFQTTDFIVYAQKTYCDETNFNNPEFAPLLATNFQKLPPVVMITTEFDILKDEEMAYVKKLRDAGVKVWHHCFAGQIHCLVGLPAEAEEFKTITNTIKTAMAQAFDEN